MAAQKCAIEAIRNRRLLDSIYPLTISRSPGETCAICLKAFETNDAIRRLSCGHTFHDWCILMWLRRHSECPVCTQNVF